MRISIDATGLGRTKTGTVVYLTEILHQWNQDPKVQHEFIIFSGAYGVRHLRPLGLDRRFKVILAPTLRLARIAWQQFVMPKWMESAGVDVHWGAGFVLPMVSTKPMVVTIHDLTFQMFPHMHEIIKRWYFPFVISRSVRQARAVLTVSKSTRADLYRLLPRSRGKTTVTPLAARTLGSLRPSRKTRSAPTKFQGYLLFIGTLEPRKNLKRLLLAWQGLDPGLRAGRKLRVVGAFGWMMGKTLRHFERDPSIEFHGEVTDAELGRLLTGSLGFVYPSLYEGFGLPVIEAMSMGLPVMTSDIGATREVAGDAAILVDPYSVDSICAGLGQLISYNELRQHLGAKGLKRAAQFSWNSTANQTLAILHKAAQSRSKPILKL